MAVTRLHGGRGSNTCGVQFPGALAEEGLCVCLSANIPQTKRDQDFLLEAQEASDLQDLTTQPQTGLSTGQKTGFASKSLAVGPRPCGGTLFGCCQVQTKLRDEADGHI